MSDTAAVVGVIALFVGLIVLRVVILGLSIWALWFGIADLVTVGLTFWGVAWTVIGGLGVLGFVGDALRK